MNIEKVKYQLNRITLLSCLIASLVLSELEKVNAQNDTIKCTVIGNPSTSSQVYNTSYIINDVVQEYGFCSGARTLFLAVIDTSICQPWETFFGVDNINHQFGNYNNNGSCRNRIEYYFLYDQNDVTQQSSLVNLLNNTIPDSAYVLLYTNYFEYYAWANGTQLSQTLQNMGSSNFSTAQNAIPFIIFFQKGNPTFTKEVYGLTPNDSISLQAIFKCSHVNTGSKSQLSSTNNLFRLFPNPNNGVFNIQFENFNSENVSVSVYNSIGEEIKSYKISNSKTFQIDLSNQSKGLYYVRIITSQCSKVEKVVLE